MEALSDCCQREADRSLTKHRKVAVCDGCSNLVLGYGDETDYERTIEELTANEVDFRVGRTGKVRLIAYRRS